MPRAGSPLRIPSTMAGKVRRGNHRHVGRRRRMRGQQAADRPQCGDYVGVGTVLVLCRHCRAGLRLGFEPCGHFAEFALLVLLVGLSVSPQEPQPVYEVDSLDTVVELYDAPRPDVGAPLPMLLSDGLHVLLAYLVSEP